MFDLVAGLGFQEDELDVMDVQHGVRDGADLHGDVVARLRDLGNMLFMGAVGGVGGQFRLVLDRFFRDDDLVVYLVEMHAVPFLLWLFVLCLSDWCVLSGLFLFRVARVACFFTFSVSVRHIGKRGPCSGRR